MIFDNYIKNVNHGFSENSVSGTIFYSVPQIDETGFFSHGFFARKGGVSSGIFESLNFSFSRETNRANVLANFRIAAEALGAPFDSLCIINYEHGNNAVVATEAERGMGVTRENALPPCDGIVVTEPSVTAVSVHADCVPIFFADRKGAAAGVCHAGWKGVYSGMQLSMIDTLRGVGATDILVGIGPHIRSCCFEVKDDVALLFEKEYGADVLNICNNALYINMERVLLKQLFSAEIPPENVTLSGMCTFCDAEHFYSHRRDKGQTGAMASLMRIREV